MVSKIFRFHACALAVAGLSLSACSEETASASGLSACDVLQAIDLKTVLGTAPAKLEENSRMKAPEDAPTIMSGCDALNGEGVSVLSLMVRENKPGTRAADIDEAIGEMMGVFGEGAAEKLSLGDGGYYGQVTENSRQLGVYAREGRMLLIFNGMGKASAGRSGLEAAAAAALEKVQD